MLMKSVNVTEDNIIVKPVVKLSMTKPQRNKPDSTEIEITLPSLPNGAVDTSYSTTLIASGGTPPYTWTIDSGTLPAGLSLDSATGVISGAPTSSGNSTFTVKVSDNSTPVKSDTEQYTISIAASGVLIITTTNVADGVKDATYSASVEALGGTPPYTWSVISGNLPDGLALDATRGAISGTPIEKGNYSFTVQVSDNATPVNTDSQQLSIRIAED
jgi:hypothetical protein